MPKRRGGKRSELERLKTDVRNLPLGKTKRSRRAEPPLSDDARAAGRATSCVTPSVKRMKEEVPDDDACKTQDAKKAEPGAWKQLIRPCPYDIDSCPFLHGTIKVEQNVPKDETCTKPENVRAEKTSVACWTADDVYRWAFAVTKSVKAAERFIEHDIDGEALLLLNRTTILKEVGLKLGPAVKLHKALEKLKATCSSE